MATINSFEGLRDIVNLFPEEAPRRTSVQVPDPGYVNLQDTGEDTGMLVNSFIFKTVFTPDDVAEFYKCLRQHPPMQHRNDLEDILTNALQEWIRKHPRQCPYEPFLWAMKAYGNFIGSEKNNEVPQPWLLEAVGNALLSVWNSDAADYLAVLKNVILNWDWYQPAHVMIYLYQNRYELNDEDLDKCLRSKWLYRSLFSFSAFQCLCAKRLTPENMQTLMRFVSQDSQRDLFNTPIRVTNRMRDLLGDYLRSAEEDDFNMAKTFFLEQLHSCSRKAREYFNRLFDLDTSTEVPDFIKCWGEADTAEKKAELRRELNRLFTKADFSRELIRAAVPAGYPDLLQEITEQTGRRIPDFGTQYLLMSILDSAGSCFEYSQFILNGYEAYGEPLTDDRGFLYTCAYCLMGHPEVLEKLFPAIYQNGLCKSQGYLFLRTQSVHPRQFAEQAARMAATCQESDEKALKLVQNCAKLYRQNNANLFPVAYHPICDKLVGAVTRRDLRAALYASSLLDLYERIVNVQNKSVFHDTLMALYYSTSRQTALKMANTRLVSLIHLVYGGQAI